MEIRRGYVYVVHPIGHNVYKIGSTVNLRTRLMRMECNHDYKLEYVATIFSDNYQQLELRLQLNFKRKLLARDWFAFTDEDIAYFKRLEAASGSR